MNVVTKVKNGVLKTSMFFAQTTIAFMAFIVCLEVILRWGFGKSTYVSTDFAAYGMGIVSYWAGAKAVEDGVFVRMDALYGIYKGMFKKVIDIIFDFILIFFNSVILLHYTEMVITTFERNLRATNMLQTPLWVPRLLVEIGIILFEIYMICRTIEDFHKEPEKYSENELKRLEGMKGEGV